MDIVAHKIYVMLICFLLCHPPLTWVKVQTPFSI